MVSKFFLMIGSNNAVYIPESLSVILQSCLKIIDVEYSIVGESRA